MKRFLAYLLGLGFGLMVTATHSAEISKSYEAVIRTPDNSTRHVIVRAADYHEAKEQIETLYCSQGQRVAAQPTCIAEGPWPR
jgi:hypothetical protein